MFEIKIVLLDFFCNLIHFCLYKDTYHLDYTLVKNIFSKYISTRYRLDERFDWRLPL